MMSNSLYNGLRITRGKISYGGELKTEFATSNQIDVLDFWEWLAGPSFSYMVNENISIKLNALFGLSPLSPHLESNLLFISKL